MDTPYSHAAARPWLNESGLATDDRVFILVSDTLQSVSHPDIFATGDIATTIDRPRPKAGVFAVRQGKPLFENLRAIASGQAPQPFLSAKTLSCSDWHGRGASCCRMGKVLY